MVRLFNTIGPRQVGHYGMVVPRFVTQALRGEDLTVYGDGAQTRSFCFADDLVEGIARLLVTDFHEPVNLGNPNEVTILEFAREILDLSGSTSKIDGSTPGRSSRTGSRWRRRRRRTRCSPTRRTDA